MTRLSGVLFCFLVIFSYGMITPPDIASALETPITPQQVCANVNKLNVRSGPGTQYDVVAGMTYGQCAEILEVSADQAWIRIEKGWVAAQYVKITAAATSESTREILSSPTSKRTPSVITEETKTPVPLGPVDKNIPPPPAPSWQKWFSWFPLPNASDPNTLALWFLKNPVLALMPLVAFYIALVSTQKFGFARLLINGFTTLLMSAVIALLHANLIRGLNGGLATPLDASLFGPVFGGYILGVLLGKLIYRRPGSRERGANTACAVCGTIQRRSRMKICSTCGKPYCDFPAWNYSSIRGKVDSVMIWIAIPLGLILTAVSILGGVIMLAMLSMPYLLLRELLPENRRPEYWRNCGGTSLCANCTPRTTYSSSHSSTESSSGGYDDSSGYDDRQYEDRSSNDRDEDDDDDKKDGSIWDGWLNKW